MSPKGWFHICLRSCCRVVGVRTGFRLTNCVVYISLLPPTPSGGVFPFHTSCHHLLPPQLRLSRIIQQWISPMYREIQSRPYIRRGHREIDYRRPTPTTSSSSSSRRGKNRFSPALLCTAVYKALCHRYSYTPTHQYRRAPVHTRNLSTFLRSSSSVLQPFCVWLNFPSCVWMVFTLGVFRASSPFSSCQCNNTLSKFAYYSVLGSLH